MNDLQCPQCFQDCQYIQIKETWAFCDTCGIKWDVGSGLFLGALDRVYPEYGVRNRIADYDITTQGE